MHQDQIPLRTLHDLLLEYEGQACYVEVLIPWLAANQKEINWLSSFSQRAGKPIPQANNEDLWHLYALSRVLELLALGFQQGEADGVDWSGPDITLQQFDLFAEALGLHVEYTTIYHPFAHEIVKLISTSNTCPQITHHH